MTIFCHLIIIAEMVCINLYIADICALKRRSHYSAFLVYFLFSLILVPALMMLFQKLPTYGNGNGLFVMTGFLYIIPIQYLYDQPFRYTVTTICSAWIYTMFAFSISVRFSYLFFTPYLAIAASVIQTVFYALTLPYFLKFIRNRFLFVLKHMGIKEERSLLKLCLLWFFGIIFLNYILINDNSMLIKFFVVVLFFFTAYLCYETYYTLVSATNNAENLEQKSRIDNLTGVLNRISFYEDAKQLMGREVPFSLYFFDLDDFKTINDRFGHLVGDEYLKLFAGCIKKEGSGYGNFYRVSGDEFIFLFEGERVEQFYQKISKASVHSISKDIPFLGFSIGYASYPKDGKDLFQLIALADQRMYEKKRQKKHKI